MKKRGRNEALTVKFTETRCFGNPQTMSSKKLSYGLCVGTIILAQPATEKALSRCNFFQDSILRIHLVRGLLMFGNTASVIEHRRTVQQEEFKATVMVCG